MNRNILKLAGACLLLLTGAPVAFAQNTTAGTQVKNEVSVSYEVGGNLQTNTPESDVSFLVDRKVDLVVNEVGGAKKGIVPGTTPSIANGYYLTYSVTNNSNDKIDVRLTVAELSGQTVLTSADNNNTSASSTFTLYLDDETDVPNMGAWDAGDTAVTYLDSLAAGDTVTLFVVPDNAFYADDVLSNDEVMGLVLTGIAASAWDDPTLPILVDVPGGLPTARVEDTGALGSDLSGDTDGDSPLAVENVFAEAVDTDGSGDAANNGKDDAYDAFVVASAAIAVTKTSTIVYDPITGEADGLLADPKAIPGALVLYCITIKNTGAEDATNVSVTDNLNGEITAGKIAFVDSNTTALTNDITAADSIRFSTVDTCTLADWDGGTQESSAVGDGGSDGLTGDFNVSGTNTVTTEVPTLGDTSGVTTTMFMVEIQ